VNHEGLLFSLTEEDPYWILQVTGFPTECAAKEFMPRAWAGLKWVLLQQGVPFTSEPELTSVIWCSDPEGFMERFGFDTPFDGAIADPSRPVVYPCNSKLISSGSAVRFFQFIPHQLFLASLAEGVSLPMSGSLFNDDKAKLALDLYNASYVEVTKNAQFLSLVMALEVMAPEQLRHQDAIGLLDEWKVQLDAKLNEVAARPEHSQAEGASRDRQEAIQSLQSLHGLLKNNDSITSRVGKMVLQAYDCEGMLNASERQQEAKQIYRLRSKLVHDGFLRESELERGIESARQIVKHILTLKFSRN
jgi:hypothetical protein